MQKHRDVLQQASRLAVAVALCIAAMLAVYALTGHFTNAVLLGALIGFVMAMGNFLSLSITVSNAMNRAANGGERRPPGHSGHHLYPAVSCRAV